MRNELGQFIKGHPPTKGCFKKGQIPWNKNKTGIYSKETIRKMSLANKDKKFSKETRRKISEAGKGSKHWNWKGGRIKHTKGYIYLFKPDHPFCDGKGYVREHRLVVESQIGRYLKPEETPHHINEILDDNKPENLMAFVNDIVHRKFHKNPLSIKPEEIIFDGRRLT